VIADLAAPQHGVVSRAQLLDAGLGPRAVEHRVETGRLHRLHRGVYAVGHRPPSPLTRVMAAVLACGPDAVASHLTAAALWDIHGRHGAPIHVTAPTSRRHPGVRLHRSGTLTSADVTTHYGIPVTTAARTLLDLAELLDDRQLTRAANEARLRRLVTLDALAAQLGRAHGRRTGALRRQIELRDGPTRSELEDAFLRFVERHGLPRPEINAALAGFEVDALWRSQRLVAELDGRAFHALEDAFERDRERDAELTAAGYRVVRITWQRLARRPAAEAARLSVLLGL
jgi:very-short-patch-repair endonuclease